MTIYTNIAASLVAVVFAIAAVPAQADHDTTGATLSADGLTISVVCEEFGGFLHAFNNEVEFTNQKDRLSLSLEAGKLGKAHWKLHEDPPKLCDAAQKLDDFSFKVRFLRDGRDGKGTKPKISDNSDGAAIACLIEGSAEMADDLTDGLDCTVVEDPPRGKGKGRDK